MGTTHLAALVLAVIAGACFLLSAFGTGQLGSIELVPIGLLFFVASVHVCHHHPG